MKKSFFIEIALLLLFFYFDVFSASAQFPTVEFQPAFEGLTNPVDIVNAHDGSNRLFVVQLGGIIKVWNGTKLSDFIDLSSVINSAYYERGLLSLVFHPGFNGTTNRYFFVYYTNKNGDIEVSRYQTTSGDSNTGDPSTGTIIITIPHPNYPGHNGGKLNFGPDGYLYFATGDGGGENDPDSNAQNGKVLLGKMLRIDVDHPGPASHPNYSIPTDNPYVKDDSVADEIWDLGLRNPFRWSFDRLTGDMWIGDVGQAAEEEVDYLPAGKTGDHNFGWRCYEGYIHTPGVAACYPDTPANYIPPVFAYVHPVNGHEPIALIGGYVYRGKEYPNLYGYYVATELYSGKNFLLRPNGKGGFDTATQQGPVYSITSFGEGEDGSLYGISNASSSASKLVAFGGGVLPVRLSRFTVTHFSDNNDLKWITQNEIDLKQFYIEYSLDANRFMRIGQVKATGTERGNSYTFEHRYTTTATTYYRLAMEDKNGRITYSSIEKVTPDESDDFKVYPTLVWDSRITIELGKPAKELQLFNSTGALVFEKSLANMTGTFVVALPSLSKGVYLVQVVRENGVKGKKIILE